MKNKSNRNGVSRKEFLKSGAAASAFLMGGALLNNCSNNGVKRLGGAKNIIFYVSDGMSIGALTSADMTMRRKYGKVSNWISLYEENRCRRALMDCAPLDAIVTDSAAAGSAWGCGHRVPVRKINMGPNGESYEPIFSLFKREGKATGLVTTTQITHATPASFAANVEHRSMQEDIANQYLEAEHDLYLGGGYEHFSAEDREDDADLFSQFEQKGYNVVRTENELQNISGNGKLLGTFGRGHLPFELDRMNTYDLERDVPSLAEMTKIAIDRLSTNPNGFIMQVEGGRVDHAAHRNDLGGLIYDQIAFDDAIGEGLKFAEKNPDTLIIITTDHGNASPTLNRSYNGYDATEIEFDTLHNFRYTNDWILSGLDDSSTINYIRERIEEASTFGITRDQARELQLALRGERKALYEMMSVPRPTLGAIIANYTSVNWTGTSHTGDYVELAAIGPGSEALDGFVKNSELFHIMIKAAGVSV
ncbi:MAG: alkaline phosphatase [Balneolaceae bacterium]|nr:MAG: alkaline phosphatase [Balneolaceae bacterium]